MSDQEKGYKCVFYHDLDCPVQKALSERTLIDKIEPIPKSEVEQYTAEMVRGIKAMFDVYLATLASFCQLCPFKHRRDLAGIPPELRRGRLDPDIEL